MTTIKPNYEYGICDDGEILTKVSSKISEGPMLRLVLIALLHFHVVSFAGGNHSLEGSLSGRSHRYEASLLSFMLS